MYKSLFPTQNTNTSLVQNVTMMPTAPSITYKQIGEEFCKYYYNTYDNNFPALSNLYGHGSCITFAGDNFGRFEDWCKKLTNDYNIMKFTHTQLECVFQPIADKAILISVTGSMYVNNKINEGGRFTETIIIVRDNGSNRYHIANTIFRVLP